MNILLIILGILTEVVAAAPAHTPYTVGDNTGTMWSTISNSLYTRGDVVEGLTTRANVIVISMIGVVATLLIMYAGIRIISSQGKEEAFSKGKEIITYALLGVALAMIAGIVLTYVGTVLLPTFVN